MESKKSTKKQSKIPEGMENIFNESNLGDMMKEVNAMLQKNPDMIKKVSKCVNNIFENENLMQKLVTEINSNIVSSSPEPEKNIPYTKPLYTLIDHAKAYKNTNSLRLISAELNFITKSFT